MKCRFLAALVVCGMGADAERLVAHEVRTVTINGTTYRETWRTVQRPVARVEWQPREITEWVDQHVTEMREWNRTVYTPRVEYQWQPRLRNRWNPLARPYWAYELVPRTRWTARVEKVKVPVAYRRVVPEKRVVQVPQRALGFEPRRELMARVPVASSSAATLGSAPLPPLVPAPRTAQRIGGVQQYEGEFPRHSAPPRLR